MSWGDDDPAAPAATWGLMDPNHQQSNPVLAPMANSPTIGPGPRTSTMPDQPIPLRPWGDVAGDFVKNLPSNLWNGVIAPTYDAIKNRPGETAKDAVRTLAGLPEALLGNPYMQPARAEALAANNPGAMATHADAKAAGSAYVQNLSDKYFSGLPKLQDTLAYHPAETLMDLSTFTPLAGEALPGKLGSVVRATGKAVDPATIAGNVGVRLPAKAIDIAGANTLGFNTGIGARSLRDIGSAGRELGSGLELSDGFLPKMGPVADNATAIVDNMNHGAPIENVVSSAKSALGSARKARSDAYKAGMKEVGQVEEPISLDPIEDAVKSANNVQDFKGVQLDPSTAETKAKIADTVAAWKALDPEHPIFKGATEALTPENYHTPVGIDALKQLVGDIRDTTEHGSPSRIAADRVYNAIGTEIRKAAPEYADVMAKYGSASGKLNEASRVFSLGERATGETAARKLLSSTRDSVATNFGGRAKILDQLAEHDSTLPYAIAGQAAQAVVPRGLVARGGLMAHMATGGAAALLAHPLTSIPAIAGMATFSPRIVGNAVYYGGRAIGTVEDVAKAMRLTPDTIRAMERGGYQAGQNNALQGNPYVGAR